MFLKRFSAASKNLIRVKNWHFTGKQIEHTPNNWNTPLKYAVKTRQSRNVRALKSFCACIHYRSKRLWGVSATVFWRSQKNIHIYASFWETSAAKQQPKIIEMSFFPVTQLILVNVPVPTVFFSRIPINARRGLKLHDYFIIFNRTSHFGKQERYSEKRYPILWRQKKTIWNTPHSNTLVNEKHF